MAEEWKHVRYVVEIKRVLQCESIETKQFCTKDTPTAITENQYGRTEPARAKEYELRDVPKTERIEQNVYRQEIDKLDLKAVIDAVNGATP